MALTEQEKQERLQAKKEQDVKDEKEVVKVLSSSNNLFVKDYNIKELDLQFSLSIRVPNLMENAAIEARLQRMFDGIAGLVSYPTAKAYHMYVLLNYEAEKHENDKEVKIPEELLGEEVYSLKPYSIIADDYEKFLERFQR